jgi:hypothetical protein
MIVSVWQSDGIQIREADYASTFLHPFRGAKGKKEERDVIALLVQASRCA